MTKSRGRPAHNDILTPAEWQIANAVRHGLTNQQIANLRKISLDGVKYHVANAIAKLGLKNRKALRYWVGWPIDSAIKSAINTTEDLMEHTSGILGLGQVSRTVKNIEKSEQWYRDTLQLPHLYTYGNLAFFDLNGTRLMLSQGEVVQDAESILYLRVSDIIEVHQKLEERCVVISNAPHMIHQHEDGSEEWMAFFEDIEKRPMAIMSTVKSADK